MAVIMGQYAVGTVATQIFNIPSGSFSCCLHTGTVNTVYLGLSTAVTSSNGYAVPTNPADFDGFGPSRGAMIYGIATAATTLNVLMVTDQ
jgi:hypothetical protein